MLLMLFPTHYALGPFARTDVGKTGKDGKAVESSSDQTDTENKT